MLPPVARELQYIAERQDGHGLLAEVNSERLLLAVCSYTLIRNAKFRFAIESGHSSDVNFLNVSNR